MNRFDGKKALITGSTQGIGAACALRLAREGADVILNGRKRDERVDELTRQVEKLGRKAFFVAADISTGSAATQLVTEAIAAAGGLDILVNNAGMEINKPFWEVSEEDYDRVMDLNLKGTFFCTQAFVNHCRDKKRGGAVVNMSSVHEEIIFPHFAAYCASKGGMKMLMRNLATELAPLNIRINNVAPGAIATPINTALTDDKDKLAKVLQNIPMKKLGTPEDVAAVVAFLASDEAGYVTGSTYFVDGGLTYHYEEQ